MKTEKDLFKGNTGKYYEAKTAKEAALMKMVLDMGKLAYKPVTHTVSAHQDFERYFVEDVDSHWMQNKILELQLSIEKEGGSSSNTGGGFKPSLRKQFAYELGEKKKGTYKWDKEAL